MRVRSYPDLRLGRSAFLYSWVVPDSLRLCKLSSSKGDNAPFTDSLANIAPGFFSSTQRWFSRVQVDSRVSALSWRFVSHNWKESDFTIHTMKGRMWNRCFFWTIPSDSNWKIASALWFLFKLTSSLRYPWFDVSGITVPSDSSNVAGAISISNIFKIFLLWFSTYAILLSRFDLYLVCTLSR